MEEALRAWLKGSDGIGDRVDWDARPQGKALPATTLHEIGVEDEYTFEGRVGQVAFDAQIDCWGATRKAARDLRRAVVARLDAINAEPSDDLQEATILRRHAGFDPAESGAPSFYRASLDVRVWTLTA